MIVKEFGGFVTVVPSNTVDLPVPAVGLYVGGAGDVKLDDFQGHTVVLSAVPVGTQIKGGIKRIYSTGTTATLLVAITSP